MVVGVTVMRVPTPALETLQEREPFRNFRKRWAPVGESAMGVVRCLGPVNAE
jgi:hypothetical protein